MKVDIPVDSPTCSVQPYAGAQEPASAIHPNMCTTTQSGSAAHLRVNTHPRGSKEQRDAHRSSAGPVAEAADSSATPRQSARSPASSGARYSGTLATSP